MTILCEIISFKTPLDVALKAVEFVWCLAVLGAQVCMISEISPVEKCKLLRDNFAAVKSELFGGKKLMATNVEKDSNVDSKMVNHFKGDCYQEW